MKEDGACCGSCIASGCAMKDGSVLSPGQTKDKEDGCGKHICGLVSGEVKPYLHMCIQWGI